MSNSITAELTESKKLIGREITANFYGRTFTYAKISDVRLTHSKQAVFFVLDNGAHLTRREFELRK